MPWASIFFTIVYSPFPKSDHQIKKENKRNNTLWKPQIADDNAGKY